MMLATGLQSPLKRIGAMIPGQVPGSISATGTATGVPVSGMSSPRPLAGQDTRGGIPGVPLGGAQTTGTAATPQATAPANTGVGGTSMFSAGSNLLGTQVNPVASPRLTGAQGQADTARNAYAGAQVPTLGTVAGRDASGAQGYLQRADAYATSGGAAGGGMGVPQYGGPGGFAYSGDTGDVRRMTLDQLKTVMNTTPDRATLAANTFQRLLDDSNPQFMAELRAANAKNAAMGRRGSGMATTDLGDVQQRREEQLMRRRAELADNAAGLALSDQMSKLDASRGVGESFAGQDTAAGSLNLSAANAAFGNALDSWNASERAKQRSFDNLRTLGQDTYGIASDLYGDRVSERDKGYNAGMDRYSAGRSKMLDLYGVESQLAADERSNRNELRGERGYQADMDQRAIDNNYNQRVLEDRLRGSDLDYAGQLMQYGYGSNPYGALTNAGTQAQGQADDALGGAYDLWSQWAKSRRLQPTGG